MRTVVESYIKEGLRRFGIEVRYMDDEFYNPEMYQDVLRGAISIKKPFDIIQVGANDGKYNDPIYKFVKEHKDSTNIVLIEPMKSVIPFLQENYSYHPSAEIINKAIGRDEDSVMRLYGINKDYWDKIDVGYGADWPDYRIPTGVATSDKNKLLQWASKNVQSAVSPEKIITEFDVEIAQPKMVVRESKVINDVHLLQVDTEGMDDQIVYSFLEQNIYPNIINIEIKHLNKERRREYKQTMERNNYGVYNYTSSEMLSVRQ